ncbi:MAG TPA: tetratricopeptide repeat protein [Gemmatimonadales bacterium]|nr:tetratricopeptide repeat protein [Gemmatimonadales bacterium]
MSYQFELDRSNRSFRFPVILMAAIVCMVTAAYVFAACGDRNPDQARASEPVTSSSSSVTPVGTVASEKPSLVISGPVTFEMADSAYRDRRYDDATTLFKAYTENRSRNPWGFYMLGLSAWKSGDRAQAESAFVQALSLDSTHVKSHLNLSRVLLEEGQPDSALTHIEAAIAIDSVSSEPLRLRGRAFEALDKTDDAIVAYQHAIVKDSGDVWALNNLGALYIRLGRFEDAIGPLARAVELNDKVATFYNNLGMALENTGRIADAITQYRAALAIEGTYGKAVSSLRRVQQVKQDPSVTAIDLTERSKQFQEEITKW